MLIHPFFVIVLGLFVIGVITWLACNNIKLRGLNQIMKLALESQTRELAALNDRMEDTKSRMDNLTDLIQRVDNMATELKNER